MKKIVSILILIVMIMGVSTVSNATTSAELTDKIYEVAKPYGMTMENKLRIGRYLKENPVSDEVAEKVLAKIEEGVKFAKDISGDKFSDLSAKDKEKVIEITHEAAALLGITLKYEGHRIYMYKGGKLIETVRYDGTRLLYTGNTGNNVNTVLVVSSTILVALVAGFALRKKFANA